MGTPAFAASARLRISTAFCRKLISFTAYAGSSIRSEKICGPRSSVATVKGQSQVILPEYADLYPVETHLRRLAAKPLMPARHS